LFLLDNAALTRMPLHTRNWQIFTLKFWNIQSSDLAHSNYYIFLNLKKHIKGRKFTDTEATLAANRRFAAQQKQFFFDGSRTTKS
jgi:hypothetical protein